MVFGTSCGCSKSDLNFASLLSILNKMVEDGSYDADILEYLWTNMINDNLTLTTNQIGFGREEKEDAGVEENFCPYLE